MRTPYAHEGEKIESFRKLLAVALSLPVLTSAAFLLVFTVLFFLVGNLLPLTYPVMDDVLVQACARQIASRPVSRPLLLQTATTYALDWLYVSDESGAPLHECAAITPGLSQWATRSRHVTFREKPFYEAVCPMAGDKYLHAGISLDSPLQPINQGIGTNPVENLALHAVMPFRGGVLLVIFILLWLVTQLIFILCINRPLSLINTKLANMGHYGTFSLQEFDSLLLTDFIASEIKELKEALRAVFIHFEKDRDELLKKDEQGRKWKMKNQNEGENPSASSQNKIDFSLASPPAGGGILGLMESKNSAHRFAEKIINTLYENFGGQIQDIIFIQEAFEEGQAPVVLSSCGLNSSWRSQLVKSDLDRLLSGVRLNGKLATLGPLSLNRLGLQDLVSAATPRHIVVAPVVHGRKTIAYLFICASAPLPPAAIATIEQACRDIGENFSSLLFLEKAEAQKWTDSFTNMRNRSFLVALLEHLTASHKERPKLQFAVCSFCIDTSNVPDDQMQPLLVQTAQILRKMTDRTGRETHHKLIPTLHELEICKNQGLEFDLVAVMENAESATILAEQIVQKLKPLLAAQTIAPDLCLGLAIFPADGASGEEVLKRARSAMHYALENKKGPVTMLRAAAVPPDFRHHRRLTAMKGELGVLDCSELLQSIASGNRSGTLTIDNNMGKTFRLVLNAGKPASAQLGKLTGSDAIVELVVTFDSGSFSFQESPEVENSQNKNLLPMMHMMMESALASDLYDAAVSALPATNRPVTAGPNAAGWTELVDNSEVSEREVAVMHRLLAKLSDMQYMTLDKILTDLDDVPTHLRMRAAALLYAYGALDFP